MSVTIRPATEADQPLLDAWSAPSRGRTPTGATAPARVPRDGPRPDDRARRRRAGRGPVVAPRGLRRRTPGRSPSTSASSWRPEARGRGIGTAAQRLLAEHLFATTSVHRVEAGTDVTNVAEQRALEKAGFTREGVLRGAQYRADGSHHDLVSYAVLRTDLER